MLNVLLHIYNTTELLDSVEKKIALFYGGLKINGKTRQKVNSVNGTTIFILLMAGLVCGIKRFEIKTCVFSNSKYANFI